ncbi:MAG: MucR family transcriptional regulator, partial [Actinomycetota bacterium]|nr:MucR family transcriptional regulator [Actinomycetota bacterium]
MARLTHAPDWPAPRPPHGEFGRLARDDDGRVQCHICGGFYDHLGAHVHHRHGLRADDYRAAFGLKQSTKLISDGYRQTRRQAAARQGLAQLGEKQRQRIREL